MKNIFSNVVSIIAVLLIVGSGVYLYQQSKDDTDIKGVSTATTSEESAQKAIVEVVYDDKHFNYEISYQTDDSVFDLLKAYDTSSNEFTFYYDELSFGVFVTAINGRVADQTKNEFWNFKINGKDSQVGVSDYKVQKGDKIQFILATY